MTPVSVSDVSASPIIGGRGADSPRYKTLDHWRGIACLIVVVHHALLPMCDQGVPLQKFSTIRAETSSLSEKTATVPKGQPQTSRPGMRNFICNLMQVGVEMFFVISGYCITASADSIRRSDRTIWEYFLRRMMRIFPSFWCALIGSVLICFAIDFMNPDSLKRAPWPLSMPWDLSFLQWVGCVTLTGTWFGFLTGESKLNFPIQAWTLCYEVQFYVVIGVLLALSRSRFFQAMTILTASVAGVDIFVLFYRIPIRGFFFDEHWYMFAAGVALYWDLHCATTKQAMTFRMIAFSVLVGLTTLASTTTIFGNGSQFSAWRAVAAMGFAGLLLFLKRYDERIAGLNYLNGLKLCGVICYSIYLTHLFPVKLLCQQLSFLGYRDDWSIFCMCIPLTLTMSILLGYLFHVSIERRFLDVRYNIANKESRSNPHRTSETPRETPGLEEFHRDAPANPPVKKAA